MSKQQAAAEELRVRATRPGHDAQRGYGDSGQIGARSRFPHRRDVPRPLRTILLSWAAPPLFPDRPVLAPDKVSSDDSRGPGRRSGRPRDRTARERVGGSPRLTPSRKSTSTAPNARWPPNRPSRTATRRVRAPLTISGEMRNYQSLLRRAVVRLAALLVSPATGGYIHR